MKSIPISLAQERLWILEQLAPGKPVYGLSEAFRFTGAIDDTALQQAFNDLILRHEVLRTTFPAAGGHPNPAVSNTSAFDLTVVDLRDVLEREREQEVRALAAEQARRPFDLARDLMLRATLVRLAETDWVLLLTLHQLAADSESMMILVRDLSVLYESCAAGKPSPLPPLPRSYSDFAAQQRKWLESAAAKKQLAFWKKRLEAAPSLLELPMDRSRPSKPSHRTACHRLLLDKSLSELLAALGEREKCRLSTVLLAAFQAMCSRYTGRSDIVIGSPSSNRPGAAKGVVGNFANLLPLRNDLSGDPEVSEILHRTQAMLTEAEAHREFPFARLIEELNPPRDPSYHPLVQVCFAFQQARQPMRQAGAFTVTPWNDKLYDRADLFYDLKLSLSETARGLEGGLEYARDLFDAGTVARMAGHLETILQGFVQNPDQRLSRLPLMPERERHELLVEWNSTQAEFPEGECLHELFQLHVKQSPDATALVCESERLTYGELNRRANRLARHLQKLGVGPEVLVGICLTRSVDMVVSMLAVLKAGGAYVPLDPAYPADRLAFILEDAKAPVLLTQRHLQLSTPPNAQTRSSSPPFEGEEGHSANGHTAHQRLDAAHNGLADQTNRLTPHPGPLPFEGRGGRHGGQAAGQGFTARTVFLDDPASWNDREGDEQDLPRQATPQNLAYVIYTSGSTGRPKGVALEHRSPVAFVHWAQQVFSREQLAGVLASTSICFDLSVFEIFVPLSSGGKVILAENALQVGKLLAPGEVTLINTVPSAITELVRSRAIPASARTVNLAGEPLETALVKQIYELGIERVYDLYGPSETTVYSTFALRRGDGPATIGRPISNTQIYLLDDQLEPAPVGVPGELHIGGAGLARGYLNQPTLTAEKFIPNPFQRAGTRLYKTGDLARYRADGTIEFLGRKDNQVKIRGFRIELGEIETVLRQHPLLEAAAVVARPDARGEKRLAAYYQSDEPDLNDNLRAWLRGKLPEYMVPGNFVRLPAMPLTPNGKIDRKALPAPEQVQQPSKHAFVAPRTSTEDVLAEIWCEVLGRERVGIDENFFEIGGHSLRAIQVISRVREIIQVELSMRDFFESPTIEALAGIIADALVREISALSEEEAQKLARSTRVPAI